VCGLIHHPCRSCSFSSHKPKMASSIGTSSINKTQLLNTPSSFSLYNTTSRLNSLLRLRPNHKTPTVSFVISAIATPNAPILTPQESFKGFAFDDANDQLSHAPVAVRKDELDISKLRFPSQLVDSLQRRGITSLFPIQVSNFNILFN